MAKRGTAGSRGRRKRHNKWIKLFNAADQLFLSRSNEVLQLNHGTRLELVAAEKKIDSWIKRETSDIEKDSLNKFKLLIRTSQNKLKAIEQERNKAIYQSRSTTYDSTSALKYLNADILRIKAVKNEYENFMTFINTYQSISELDVSSEMVITEGN